MIFRQITHDDLGCASYLIGDDDAGVVAVVDPKLAIDEYLALARYMGVHIEHILEKLDVRTRSAAVARAFPSEARGTDR